MNIAVLGVDGSGKSTVLSALKEIIGEDCLLVYMGYRDFSNKKITLLSNKPHKNIFERIQFICGVYSDLKKRIKDSNKFHGTVIYDRYVHEIYINATGFSKYIYTILYKYFFPRPQHIVYLHCKAETSFSRKDDIQDKEQFIRMKQRFDFALLNKENVLTLSSDDYSPYEIAYKIIEYVQN